MRLINPIIPGEYRYPTITPFTIPDGHTYLKTLERLVDCMKDLIDSVNENNEEMQTFVVELINSKIDEINTAFAEFEGEVDDKLEFVDTKISDLETFVNSEISTLVTYVNDSVQQIINNSIEVQDPVIAGAIGDSNSATHDALELWKREGEKRVDVRWFAEEGVVTSTSIQNAINYLSNIIITTEMGDGGVVYIPPGTYELDTGIVQPTHVHVITEGTVIFLTDIVGEPVWWVRPVIGDPVDISGGKVSKQQWNWAELMSANGGAFIFKNNRATRDDTLALEVGERSDPGALSPSSRYAMSDIAIENYDQAMQWNTYRNYIATFNRFHIELNNNGVKYGTGVIVVDSGEKITWNDSLFAVQPRGVGEINAAHHIACDTVSIDFFNCSGDYLNDFIRFSENVTGFQTVNIWGGNLEEIEGRIVRSRSTPTPAPPVVNLMNPSIITTQKRELFSGHMILGVEATIRSINATDETPVSMVSDPNTRVTKFSVKRGGAGYYRLADQKNLVDEFNTETWTLSGQGSVRSVDDGVFNVEISETGHGILTSKLIPCKPGDMFAVTCSALLPIADSRISTRMRFYDINGEVISVKPEVTLGIFTLNEMRDIAVMPQFIADKGAYSAELLIVLSATSPASTIQATNPALFLI